MSLNAALTISGQSIGNIGAQIGLLSHNIANAQTPDYAVESLPQTAFDAGGVGLGAVNGAVQRAVDQQGQADLLAQNAAVASLQTQSTALQRIDAVAGAVGGGLDLGSLLGQLGNDFSALAGSPDSQTQQQQVVAAAGALASQINAMSNAVQSARQGAQTDIVATVAGINDTLATLGSLSQRIVRAQGQGQGTADLQNQRAAAEDKLSKLVSARFLEQPNGDLLVVTQGGLNLPIHGPADPLSTAPASVGPGAYAPGGGLPAITLGGQDVTAQLTGGQLGGDLVLRDTTLPTMQANLDEFAQTLSSRFAAQGLTLFTNAAGVVPTPATSAGGAGGGGGGGGGSAGVPAQSGYIGYAGQIQVNPSVLAKPSLVRDGTDVIAGGAGGATAFTPNPAGGPAGFTALISRVLQYALGAQVADGVAQPAPNVTGLGPSGTLNAGFAAPSDLAGLATAVTATQAQTIAATASQLTGAQDEQTTLQTAYSAATSVSIDSQMSLMIVLQNAYGANARMLSAIQSLFSTLLQAVQ